VLQGQQEVLSLGSTPNQRTASFLTVPLPASLCMENGSSDKKLKKSEERKSAISCGMIIPSQLAA
jgi:hypothetical protein